MSIQIYLNGNFVPPAEARISVFDHGFLYGDGVFEGIRIYNGRIFKLEEHLERFYESARTIMLNVPLGFSELAEVVAETCRRSQIYDGYIRLVISRGPGDLGLDPRKCPEPTLICIADRIQLYPEECYTDGLKVATVPTRRNIPDALDPRIKSLNYLNNIMAKIEAHLLGMPEVIMLNSQGYVAECTGDNIFMIRKGRLITPPPSAGALKGITRDTVMDLARQRGIEVAEELFTRHDLYNADECFLTGTAAEVIPVVEVDGRTIGSGRPGEMTSQLIADFHDLTGNQGYQI